MWTDPRQNRLRPIWISTNPASRVSVSDGWADPPDRCQQLFSRRLLVFEHSDHCYQSGGCGQAQKKKKMLSFTKTNPDTATVKGPVCKSPHQSWTLDMAKWPGGSHCHLLAGWPRDPLTEASCARVGLGAALRAGGLCHTRLMEALVTPAPAQGASEWSDFPLTAVLTGFFWLPSQPSMTLWADPAAFCIKDSIQFVFN